MHNDAMSSPLPSTRSRVARLAVSALATVLVLGACSGGDDESDAEASSGETSAYPEVSKGVDLTDPGSKLDLGEKAVVAWEPRADTTGALALTPQSFERATMKAFSGWKLDEATLASTPYYVHVSVENVGETDLGGVPVPLYLVDGSNTLIQQSTFQSSFAPCASTALPAKFPTGASAELCLVYLAPAKGELEAASFRPTQAFDPITWTGEVTDAAPVKKAGKKAGTKVGRKKSRRAKRG